MVPMCVVMKIYLRDLLGMVCSIQSASSSFSSIVIAVSTRIAEVWPWINVQEIGDQTVFFGLDEPVFVGIAGATKTST
jgi:hypothetical protein